MVSPPERRDRLKREQLSLNDLAYCIRAGSPDQKDASRKKVLLVVIPSALLVGCLAIAAVIASLRSGSDDSDYNAADESAAVEGLNATTTKPASEPPGGFTTRPPTAWTPGTSTSNTRPETTTTTSRTTTTKRIPKTTKKPPKTTERSTPATTRSTASDSNSETDETTPSGEESDNIETPSKSTPSPKSTTTRKPTKQALPSKVLLCTSAATRHPPDGICDFLLYSPSILTSLTTSGTDERDALLSAFIEHVEDFQHTKAGLDIQELHRSKVSKHMGSRSSEIFLRDLWRDQVRHFGVLDFELTTSTRDSVIHTVIKMLKEIDTLQKSFRGPREEFGYYFLGVAVLYKKLPDTDEIMKAHFQLMISEAKPDAVVFRTTYLRRLKDDALCRSTGPSLWAHATMIDQPTFVETLEFRKTVDVPRNITQLLSLTPSGRWTKYNITQQIPFDMLTEAPDLGDNRTCVESVNDDKFAYVCRDGSKYGQFHTSFKDVLDKQRITRILRGSTTSVLSYDDKFTVLAKMCKAQKEFGFFGGWLVFSAHKDDVLNSCKDTTYTDGYAFLHYVKDYMRRQLREC
ncbi:uncharacterized protein LOC135389274 [Ornithodoros turicata]|uniref:uncharacterized protein LOC135389274 n=1 Tax=Ornithodoros turicata TaxID=34597 RepID=UPI003139B3FA